MPTDEFVGNSAGTAVLGTVVGDTVGADVFTGHFPSV